MGWRILSLLLALLPALGAAEVTQTGSGGFTTTHTVTTPAAPGRAWQALTRDVDQWWNGAHSWSADAANLYVDATPGGCFCEHLPGGGWVEHLRLIYLAPGKELRFRGALGPLMTLGLTGTMSWTIEANPDGAGSTLTFTYLVSGNYEPGFDGLAPAVDGVIGEQLTGLASHLAD